MINFVAASWKCSGRVSTYLVEYRIVYRNYYKGHMDKTKGEGGGGRVRFVQLGWGGGMGEKAYNCN